MPRSDLVTAFVSACLKHRRCGQDEIAAAVEEWLTDWRRLSVAGTIGDEDGLTGTAVQRATVGMPPHQLPAGPPSLVGRESDLAVLDSHLVHSSCAASVSVITGIAGVGKTALAVSWARRIADQFPDGQIYLDLRGSQLRPMQPKHALMALLRGLGLAETAMPIDLESQVSSYRSLLAGRRMLVVLDNVLDAGQVRPLLPADPGCLAVVTGRNRLSSLVAKDGAHRLILDRLSPVAARQLLSAVIGHDHAAGFESALDEIAEMCMHLPLSLRIAGTNLADRPYQSISDYAAELRHGDRLTALAVDGDEGGTLRAAFEASYRVLGPEAQQLLCQLGLMGWSEVTVEGCALMGGVTAAEARKLLEKVAAEHLIEPVDQDQYILHDLVRDFATERGSKESIK